MAPELADAQDSRHPLTVEVVDPADELRDFDGLDV